jgi:predicted ATP-grasp superfamily ATP-dependent carboligase
MRTNSTVDEVKHRGKYNIAVKKLQARAEHQQSLLKHTQEQIQTQQELHAVGVLLVSIRFTSALN